MAKLIQVGGKITFSHVYSTSRHIKNLKLLPEVNQEKFQTKILAFNQLL